MKEDQSRTFKMGASLFLEGDASNQLYIVKSGKVGLFRTTLEGRVVLLGVLKEKDVLGEMDILTKTKRRNSAFALEETEVISIPATDIQRQMPTFAAWVNELMTNLSNRLSESEDLIVKQKIFDVPSFEGFILDPKLESSIKTAILKQIGR